MTVGRRVIAALVTPRQAGGWEPDWRALERILELVSAAGVDGVCLGGATSEYPHWSVAGRKQVLRAVAAAVGDRLRLVAGVGASVADDVWGLGEYALSVGCEQLLIPPPGFYHYDQTDLLEFYHAAARRFPGRVLLYNLPGFTTPLTVETIRRLLGDGSGIMGIKDSSGDPMLLRVLADRPSPDCRLLLGSDELLVEGLALGWDGVVSGVASCCPELVVKLVRAWDRGNEVQAGELQGRLVTLCRELDRLPFPWGIRACLEARGIATGPRPWPVSTHRLEQERVLRQWFVGLLAEMERESG